MNVVVLVVDTLRYDHVGSNDAPDPGVDVAVETPNFDRLAERSYAFDRAFAASFPTIAHRTDVLTGRYGAPFHPWSPLDTDVPTLPRQLAAAGYVTQLVHDTPHLVNGGHRFDYPFQAWTPIRGAEVDRAWISDDWSFLPNWAFDDRFDGFGIDRDERAVLAGHNALKRYVHNNRDRRHHEEWNAARLFRTAARFLGDNASREDFLLWLDCFDPHEPWDAPPEYVRKYDDGDGTIDPRSFYGEVRNAPELPDAAVDHVRAQYEAKVTFVDRWFGYFLDALEATGLDETTALVVMGDHGTNLREFPERGFGKNAPPREREAHVPLFLAVPGTGADRSDALVQPQDVFATVANLAGAAVPDGVESHDLREIAEDDRTPRELALTGTVVSRWEGESGVLGYATDGEWSLGFAADPADCELRRFGERPEVSDAHPDVRDRLRRAAIEELDRRGLDPAIRDWLEGDDAGDFPGTYRATDGRDRPPGWRTYFSHPFNE